MRGDKKIPAWGTGKPVRDFVYVKDVAKALVVTLENYDGDEFFNISSGLVVTLENYDGDEFFNISSGTQVTIKELYDTVVEEMGFEGEVEWDTSKPDGQMYKGFDVSKMKKLIKFSCDTSLRAGLRETIKWFVENYDKPGAIRL